jgi:hypothetical protein
MSFDPLSLFLFDEHSSGPEYMIGADEPRLVLDSEGGIAEVPSVGGRVRIPLFPATSVMRDTQEQRAIEMLLRVAGEPQGHVDVWADVRYQAEFALARNNRDLGRVLTSKHHPIIEPGFALAVTSPEYAGVFIRTDDGRVGLCVMPHAAVLLSYGTKKPKSTRFDREDPV